MRKKTIVCRRLKSLCAVVMIPAVLGGLAACGIDNSYTSHTVAQLPAPAYSPSPDKPAWQIDGRKDNKLLWYVNADWWNKSFGKDMVTRQIKKDLNVDIEFVTGDDSKLNTYFAGGDLPDLITVLDANSRVVKAAKNWAYPLDDLADKYDPYFHKVTAKQTMDWYRQDDEKTYGYPSYSNTEKDYGDGTVHASSGFIIRKDVLAAIGKQDFTTPEGFLAGMRAIKEKFPDLIPFGFNEFNGTNSSLDVTLQNTLGVPTTKAGHRFYDRREDKDYLTWLDTFRRLHAAGGISDDSFADDGDAFNEKIQSGKYASIFMASVVNHGLWLQTWATAHPDSQYVAIDGLRSTQGRKPILTDTGLSGWTINFISKGCRNPSKAIQVFTYLLSDYGQMLVNYGFEGKTYTRGPGNIVRWTPEANKVRLTDSKKWQSEYRMAEFVLFGHDRYKALNPDSFTDAVRQIQNFGQPWLTTQYEIENIAPDQGTLQARSYSAIETKWSTILVSLMRSGSEKDFKNLVEQYGQFQKENRIDEINKIRDAKIAANLNRLKGSQTRS